MNRNFETPGRSCVRSRQAMVAASHYSATLAGMTMLQKGGNALDAALAACAVQNVVEPASTSIGGDCFALISRSGGDDITAYNGSGRAPMGASSQYYRDKGWSSIAKQTAHCVSIPGAVEAWFRLSQDHGKLDFGEVLQPAIDLAENGVVVSPRSAFDWKYCQRLLRNNEHARRIFLHNDKTYAAGQIHYQKELAQTLKLLAKHGADEFYNGSIAHEIVDYLQGMGGLHTRDDFKNHQGDYQKTIHTDYKDHTIHVCGPNGQGLIALMILNILEGFKDDLSAMSADRFHLEIEATRLAYSYRDSLLADPTFTDVPVEWLLSKDLATKLRHHINPKKATWIEKAPLLPDEHNTVYISAVDKDGMSVGLINSVYEYFGSGLVTPTTGILLQNRAMGFSLEEGHPNELMPGKRPMHTLMPTMVTKNGRVCLSSGVIGGSYQAMGNANLLRNIFDFKMDVQTAIEHPRLFPVIGEKTVETELTMNADVLDELEKRGHTFVHQKTGPIGAAQAIHRDLETNVLSGGSDHRKDGCALGL